MRGVKKHRHLIHHASQLLSSMHNIAHADKAAFGVLWVRAPQPSIPILYGGTNGWQVIFGLVECKRLCLAEFANKS